MRKEGIAQKQRSHGPGQLLTNSVVAVKKAAPAERNAKQDYFMSTQTPPIEPIAKRFPALEEQEIVLTFFEPEAREVYVAGNFNNWHTDSTPMTNRGEGEWVARLMLRSGRYEYRFVVDGRWSEDPQASERVTNPYGDFNSVLVVPLADRTFFL